MMMLDELKPCPHCNVVPEIIGGGVFAFCHCYAEEYEDGPFDINIWNTRPIEDALRAENARLRAALESLRRGDKEHDSYCKYDGQDGLYFCTCSARNTNAIIDAALKGDG